jgi:hypothetical protein
VTGWCGDLAGGGEDEVYEKARTTGTPQMPKIRARGCCWIGEQVKTLVTSEDLFT